MNIILWIIQILLAFVFISHGWMMVSLPPQARRGTRFGHGWCNHLPYSAQGISQYCVQHGLACIGSLRRL